MGVGLHAADDVVQIRSDAISTKPMLRVRDGVKVLPSRRAEHAGLPSGTPRSARRSPALMFLAAVARLCSSYTSSSQHFLLPRRLSDSGVLRRPPDRSACLTATIVTNPPALNPGAFISKLFFGVLRGFNANASLDPCSSDLCINEKSPRTSSMGFARKAFASFHQRSRRRSIR